jgi:hypothetical protein
MSDNNNLEYSLPQNAYANFDAVSLKDFIIQRLNTNAVFTDQNYEGSNLAAFNDIIAYSYHVLLFYLNQTASESLFSQTDLYENMNRIVKLIGYKPTGKQTSLVPMSCVANASLAAGSYILRKYSYFLVDNIQYTLLDDFPFEKVTTATETIASIGKNMILSQGTVGEYPLYTSEGVDFETFPIVVDNIVDGRDTRFISHGSITVYVKELDSDLWFEYSEVDSLYLSPGTSKTYELRLNENGHYEVKFGNDTFGRKLKLGDQVAVYYILSNGDKGIISKNVINGNKIFNFTSRQFDEIYTETNTDTNSEFITLANSGLLSFTNTSNSTSIQSAETVEEIRQNAPFLISAQLRLVTERDYEVFIKKTLPNIINSVKVVSNESYIAEYINYFYRICADPNKANRVILNQVNFADSCDFNNINVFCVPKFSTLSDASYPEFISESFKNLIIDLTKDKKMISNEVVPRDPIYVAFDLGFDNGSASKDVYNDTRLVVTRETKNKINKETLKKRVKDIIVQFFDASKNALGQKIDITELTTSILSLEGVKSIRTENTKTKTNYNGISFISWNPLYENVDEEFVNQTTTLPFFKFPYFYRPNALINKIEVVDE